MRRHWWTVAAVLALAAALAGGSLLSRSAGSHRVTAPPAPAPAPPPVAPAPTRTPVLSATSGPAVVTATAAATPTRRTPAPHIAPYGPSGAPSGGGSTSPTPRPTRPSPPVVPVNIDGCDHDYGAPTQCVPWAFPPGVTDRCQWLLAHGYGAMPVVGTDRLGLDPDHDGIACGPVR